MATTTTTKRDRGPNKDQFVVWTQAFEVFNLHYKVYHDTQDQKEFWKLVAAKVGYGTGDAAQTAANTNIRKWVEAYVQQTGPNNTGAEKLNYQEITKQRKRNTQELSELVQSYVPIYGCRKRFKQNENKKPLKQAPVKDSLENIGFERKRTNDMLEENNYFGSKKVCNINIGKDCY